MAYLLEIHHIGISGGDATMILVRHYEQGEPRIVCKVLIDAGGESYEPGHTSLSGYLADYGPEPFDYIIASHYHADHIAGFAHCGIRFQRFIDMGGYATGSDHFDPINQPSSLTDDGTVMAQYQYHVHNVAGARQDSRVNLPFLRKEHFDDAGVLKPGYGGPVTLRLVSDSGITLTCYCAGGVLANGTNVLRNSIVQDILKQISVVKVRLNDAGKLALQNGQAITEAHLSTNGRKVFARRLADRMAKVSPNDLSLAFILEWNNFRYFTAGDLSGDLSQTRYANMEEPLIDYLRDDLKLLNDNGNPITVMKATHHGSNHNNYPAEVRRAIPNVRTISEENDDDMPEAPTQLFQTKRGKGLLDELGPTTIVVSANQMKGVPGGEYIERAQAYCVARNRAIGLNPSVFEDLAWMKFHLVWQKYQQFAQDMGPESMAAKQVSLLERLTTISFINGLQYPHPAYRLKQKADSFDLYNLAKTVPRTNVQGDASKIINGTPRAVVVYYPTPEHISTILPTSELLYKTNHLVAIDGRSAQIGALQQAFVAYELSSLTPGRYNRVKEFFSRQLELLGQVVAADTPTRREGIEYIARNYPSLISRATNDPRLDPNAITVANLTALITRAYQQSTTGSYAPVSRALNFYERTTVIALVNHTPDTVGNKNVFGDALPRLPNNVSYREDRPIGDGLPVQLSKRPRTRSVTRNN